MCTAHLDSELTPPSSSTDTRGANGGFVYYRKVNNPATLGSIKSTLFTTNLLTSFTPAEAVVATWSSVGFYM